MRLNVKYSGNILIGILSIDLTIVRLHRGMKHKAGTQGSQLEMKDWPDTVTNIYQSVSSLKVNIKMTGIIFKRKD